jgi:hypothetical protein
MANRCASTRSSENSECDGVGYTTDYAAEIPVHGRGRSTVMPPRSDEQFHQQAHESPPSTSSQHTTAPSDPRGSPSKSRATLGCGFPAAAVYEGTTTNFYGNGSRCRWIRGIEERVWPSYIGVEAQPKASNGNPEKSLVPGVRTARSWRRDSATSGGG